MEAIPLCAEALIGIANIAARTAEAHRSFVRLKPAMIDLLSC
jgi:hypothetical protein